MKNKNYVFGLGFRAVFVVLFSLCVFMGCTKKNNASGELEDSLYVYNWISYTPRSIIEKFEKEFNVHVSYDVFASNEEMYAKIQSGAAGYDIVFPSADYTSIMIGQGMFVPIDKSMITNLTNIDPLIFERATYDPNMEYSVPYYWGASCVIVNTEYVKDYERSWNIFGRKDLAGKMVMLDDMREVLGDALAAYGYSINTKDPMQIQDAANKVIDEWKPNLVKFDSEAFAKGYSSGDFWVVQGYVENVLEEIGGNAKLRENTVAFIPKEGGPSYIDNMCILKGAKHPVAAHEFINFIHRPEIYAEFVNYFGLPATVNIPAREFVENPAYSTDDLSVTEVKEDLGESVDIYNDVWFNKVRIGK
ncbi:MAG: extracellular solute-binding protein [Termitinemataceae bacterium]|nr:MAG: extracellular solute-binding protein [Termitinemataceae bacterium]